ncbi:MAG TPA: SDR family oxidoreductase [Acidimicrobiales bacterium]|nr:SDR family oxidoreductase [Acidimicrobiales bacterium]
MTIDMHGKVVLVTGATGGIGKETARALARAGATVILSGRDAGRLAAAVADVRSGAAGSVEGLSMDLASLQSVRTGANELLDRWDRLDVLINNAGVILSGRQVSPEGYELTFATNHLGHFLLTTLLLDRLKASAPSRIVNVSSTAHRGARSMGFDDLQSEKSYSAMGAYNRSKLANILFTRELARRLEGTGVSAFAVHPGVVRSGWGKGGDTRGGLNIFLTLALPIQISPKMGAAASVYAASHPGLEVDSGAFLQRLVFGNFGPVHPAQTSAMGQDDAGAAHLWELSQEMVSAHP